MGIKAVTCQKRAIKDIHGTKTRKCIVNTKSKGKYKQKVHAVSGSKKDIRHLYKGVRVDFVDF